MFVLVLYHSSTNFPLIGPFKTADAAIKHLSTLSNPPPGADWRIAKINKPEVAKPKAKSRAKRKK